MKKITLKISAFLLLALFALQVHAQPCPELWNEPGIYKISTCGVGGDVSSELYMTINGTTGDLEWAALLPGDDPTQLWTVTDHRMPASAGYVEIWATIPGIGDFTMAVDQSTYDGSGVDPEIRLTVMPGQPIGDTMDPNYEYDQFQRRKATGWTGAGNNALFAKPPGQGNLRYSVTPSSAGDQVLFQNGGTISPIRFILVSTLSTEAFDASSIFIANPVKNELFVKGLTSNISQVAIYSLLGQEVLSRKLNGESSLNLDISGLTSGMYIVDFKGENGSLTKKIVKQ
ncbi:T9SS type A sorting domain-containing protein [Sabulilitoribacter multivorans]|uniref:T9SS type A sorting domain-containing protein n=1 Tax=Flaviramulus multivorans TaxID=1304750 RepID=A0ABS9ILQ3_9FLAO|nr:T9SS type A sorting domain-containing protein [Flaviramulus multivorans]MCF7561534.1 T9SS type A sorting domain-containing protein [Flaviramulus multivorans]